MSVGVQGILSAPVCACLRLSAPVCACLRLSACVGAQADALAHRQMRWRTGKCVGAQAGLNPAMLVGCKGIVSWRYEL